MYQPRKEQDEVLVATIVSQEENKIIVQVPAVQEGGINTGVKVRCGKTISFFAMGLISYDGGYHFTTPEGILANEFGLPLTKAKDEGKPTYMIWPNEAAYRTDGGIPGRVGSLIGWIGSYDPMKAFVVGTKREFDIDEEGDLYLAVNDAKGTYGDNVGEFRVEITLTESSFETLTSRGLLTKVKQSDDDAWRNKHRISFLIRPGRKVELDIALAERQEPKDALTVSFTFGGEQWDWDNLITSLKEFVVTNKIDWLSFEGHDWGESWSIHGQNLRRYFTQFSFMGWLNREFNPAPTWYSGPRSGTGDPANSSTIEFTLLQP